MPAQAHRLHRHGWWAVPHPNDNYAVLNLGIYTVTSTSLALVTTVIGLVLVPLAIALNRQIAWAHARAARSATEGGHTTTPRGALV